VAVPDVGKEDFTGDAVVKHDEACSVDHGGVSRLRGWHV
jgi:hypothetical protein